MNTRFLDALSLLLLLCTTVFSQSHPATSGKEQAVDEVTLDTELKFTLDPEFELPPAVKSNFTSSRLWAATNSDESLCVSVSRFEASTNIPPDLGNAVKQAISNVAKILGDADPKFEIKDIKVSGLDARWANYEGPVPYRMYNLATHDGLKLFQIQILYKPDRSEDAQRIFKSIKISTGRANSLDK
jgi:hypothetical protein